MFSAADLTTMSDPTIEVDGIGLLSHPHDLQFIRDVIKHRIKYRKAVIKQQKTNPPQGRQHFRLIGINIAHIVKFVS